VAWQSDHYQEDSTLRSGSDGRFEVANLPAGNYSVSVMRGGYLRLGYGQKRPGDPPRRVEVADGQIVADVNFVLPRMSVISGRVYDEVGEPIAGVTISAQQMRFYEGRRKLVPLGGICDHRRHRPVPAPQPRAGRLLRRHQRPRDVGKRWAAEGDAGGRAESKWAEDSRMVRTVKSDKVGTFKLPALPHGDYLAIALEYVLDGDWNDPQFLESLRERATRVSLREGEGGTVAHQVKAGS
jgi:hypothetical protein